MRRSRLKIILLYFTSQFSVYTKFGVDPRLVVSVMSFIVYGGVSGEAVMGDCSDEPAGMIQIEPMTICHGLIAP